jgi:hypothetical protein
VKSYILFLIMWKFALCKLLQMAPYMPLQLHLNGRDSLFFQCCLVYYVCMYIYVYIDMYKGWTIKPVLAPRPIMIYFPFAMLRVFYSYIIMSGMYYVWCISINKMHRSLRKKLQGSIRLLQSKHELQNILGYGTAVWTEVLELMLVKSRLL